jgi:hypothetical protein
MKTVITYNPRISHTPKSFLWDDLTGVGNREPYTGSRTAEHSIEDSIAKMKATALGTGKYDPAYHQLLYVVWSDGSKSWASFKWSIWQGKLTLYVQSAAGSEIMTVHEEN